ncbi:tripartite tricarboxylate transporter substrate binding protein [Verminephrobacter eiseniae]|nr:tripartite tricarboxylate transporter substrate binding protein [Verminephrobacter eiseniae]MCW8185495.1 tripartite tricarboxylate transporter substrate binding protein [Verminephrobacter eiseniae]MCW8224118.1 tripartite tricarboxylate transporter substrate binding protein [Verminephrobacter eiseniae]MCW8235333.1 tripartite tricarboxylate transporter substrate binding protein [Verminephrobacter eiseniae]
MMLRHILAVAVTLLISEGASAQAFPSRPVTIIVGVAPGGTLDTLARLVAASLTTDLEQPVIVENVVGAGGLIGFQRLLKADPNGYTLMFSNPSMVLIPLLYPKAGIDAVSDVEHVGQVATVPMVLAVSNSSGITSLPSMLARMRDGSLKPDLGSDGPGTTSHLAEALFLRLAKGAGQLVQYRGSGPAITDLMAGTIDGIIDQTVTLMQLHQGQRIKAIALAAPRRIPQMPDVPTFAEGGLPAFDFTIWNGVFAPKGTPKAVMATLSEALSRVIDRPEFKARLEQMAAQAPAPSERGSDALRQIVQIDQKRLAGIAQSTGLQAR